MWLWALPFGLSRLGLTPVCLVGNRAREAPVPNRALCTYVHNARPDDWMLQIDALNDKFAEARDEIELAMEDHETVYFQEGYETADKITRETLGLWEGILTKLEGEPIRGAGDCASKRHRCGWTQIPPVYPFRGGAVQAAEVHGTQDGAAQGREGQAGRAAARGPLMKLS